MRSEKYDKMRNLSLIIIFILTAFSGVVMGQNDKLSHLRTQKKIVTVDKATAPYYAIQILALKLPPQEPEFFNKIDAAREFACVDGYVRYVVGEYQTFKAAAADLSQIQSLGYADAFVVNTAKYNLSASGFASTNQLVIDPNKTYLVQIGAFRFPVYLSHFENVNGILEFYMKDKIYRYCVGKYQGSEVESELNRMKELGYKNAFIVEWDKYQSYQIE
jgi:hypothetical protein